MHKNKVESFYDNSLFIKVYTRLWVPTAFNIKKVKYL